MKNLVLLELFIEDGTEWFVARDVAKCLGYTRPEKAVIDHVDDDYKLRSQIRISGQRREVILINEAGVYQLIFSSKLPDAKEFQKWVFEEVLPSIRESGGYLDLDRKEIRETIIESRMGFTSTINNLALYCNLTYEQTNYLVRRLSMIANNMVGLNGKGLRDGATTKQMLKLDFIESSFTQTINKRIRKYIVNKESIDAYRLIDKCEKDALKRLKKVKFKVDKVFINVI